jgi:transcriptional regulator with GAF, ATPase, and Fis domain
VAFPHDFPLGFPGHVNPLVNMPDFSRVIGTSPAIQEIFNVITRVVPNREISVLICGETGTGKEVIARTIHENSTLGDELFVDPRALAGIRVVRV